MKTFSKLIILIAVLILSNLNSQAQKNYNVLENSNQQIRITFTTSEITSINVKTDLGNFSRIQMNDYLSSSEVGNPELPEMVKLLEIPICNALQMEVIPGNYTDYDASALGIQNPIFPAQPSYSKSFDGPIALVKNNTTYSTNAFYGKSELATVEIKGIMRNINLASISISPIQYNPVTNQIRVYQSIEVKITFVNPNFTETNRIKQLHASPLFQVAESNVINPKEGPTFAEMNYTPVKLVIVAPQMFADQLASYVAWKRRKGFIVDLALTSNAAVGTTTTSIKNYLKAQYENATLSNPAPTFVLFVGDVAQIPTFNGVSASHVTDLYYATYTTGDSIPDCYYGRFSATSEAQLAPQLEKSLMYEQYTMPDPTYLDKAVLVAGTDASFGPTHANGQMNYLANNYINTGYGYSTIYTHLYPASSQAAQIRTEIGTGVGYANYTAHCGSSGWADPSFETSHVPAMANENKYGLMIGNCCQSGMFGETECFGEALLRAPKKGAMAYIGASNYSYWDEDYYWSVGVRSAIAANTTYQAANIGAYDRLFHTHNETSDKWMTTNGALVHAGNLAVESSSSSMKLYYWEIYHLFGDPSIMTYLTQAPVMTVTASQVLMIGANSMSVTAAPYAYVALVKNGVLLGAAFADASGNANLTFDPLSEPGTCELAVWAQNYQQYFSTIDVIVPSGSYVIASTATVTPGDVPYFNSILSLDLILSNLGVANASNVYVKLSSPSPYVTVLNDSIFVGSIVQGNNHDLSGAFSVQIANFVPNQTPAQLNFEIHSNNNIFNKVLTLNLLAPHLVFETSTITANTGNNDGIVDPGETITVTVTNKNEGQGTLYALTSRLNSFYSGATITNNMDSIEAIASGQSVSSEYTVQIASTVTPGTIIPLYHTFYKGDYVVNKVIYIVVGRVMEDFETNTFTTYPWVNSSNAWIIVNSNVYAGTYSAKSKNNLSNNGSSALQITLTALSDGNISYFRNVSSEDGYDFFNFYIDGVEKESISGTTGSWALSSFPVAAGSHTYKFEYKKDNSQISGSDCAWIDNITFPPFGTVAQADIAQLQIVDHTITVNAEEVSPIPFETNAQITVNFTNPSAITAQNIEAHLDTDHPDVIINQGTTQLPVPNMLQNDNQSVTFPVRSQSRNLTSANVNFVFSLQYNGTVIDYPFSALFEGIAQGICEMNEMECLMFPIPAKNYLTVQTENPIQSIELIDLNGKRINYISSVESNNHTFAVSGLSSGIYFVKVVDVNQKIAVKKLIKQ
jgi:hypothetical protein